MSLAPVLPRVAWHRDRPWRRYENIFVAAVTAFFTIVGVNAVVLMVSLAAR
jgi:hypothetical protein